ncbi:hypothetical protein HB943_12470 [Listeria weihenstephanensis]|uniref:Uncharacterized protein n=1 Tax=Listeria weihenstephanensis TaxID=1006155 RepID=A0A841Z978_9LIST|nr:hypothetical protein [Listeria weihenstephanensis]MBC1501419.1 hypothetical protein [Listeria weihenstephanensis]
MKKKYIVPIALLGIVIILLGTYFVYNKNQEQLFFESHKNNGSLVEQSQFIYKNKGRRISKILDSLEIDYKTSNWDNFIEVMYIRTDGGTFTFAPQNDETLLMKYEINKERYISIWLDKNDEIRLSTNTSSNLSEKEIETYQQLMLNEYRKLLNSIYQNQ